MKSRTFLWFLLLALSTSSPASNYLINGGQESRINYEMVQRVTPAPQTNKLVLSFVVPESFSSPTYNQNIVDFDLSYSQRPSDQRREKDRRGNTIIRATWDKPRGMVTTKISISASNKTNLRKLQTTAPFPLKRVPRSVAPYLKSSRQIPSKDVRIKRKAIELTYNAKTEFDAIQQILTWVVDNVKYVLVPEQYDAMYSFETGKGNCQNYSHLAAALMRAVNIPVRIVNGVTLKEPYDIKTTSGILSMRMAQGRHSWIEVYFPGLGWVPFDPQQTALYVSNRFIRVEIGVDNEETENDGLIRWTQARGASGRPQFEEIIDAAFLGDQVNLNAARQEYGPSKLLFVPQVEASFTRIQVAEPAPEPAPVPPSTLQQLRYSDDFVFGNLEFPQNVDFTFTRGPVEEAQDGAKEMKKNFLVETAEYVTTKGNQYAQTFILQEPIELQNVSLALHRFGGDGQLWVELAEDDGSGRPGKTITTSDILSASNIPFAPGYRWVDFSFAQDKPRLSPGRYWIAFGFTGSPIINWFYSYGKPVGPPDGTRYKTLFDETWSRSLNFEFNYRIVGKAAN